MDPSPVADNRRNKGWQSAAIGFKYLNQMALRGFLMLLRVKNVGFPSSLWKINVLTWCGWPKMNHARSSWKQVSFQEENVHQFLQNSEACCWHNTRQSYNHCHILHNFSFTTSSSAYSVNSTDLTSISNPVVLRQCSCSQSSHHTDVPWWKWYPFDGTFTIITWLGFVRFLALSKNQVSPCREALFKDPRPS